MLATEWASEVTEDSCDDVLQMVVPAVGYGLLAGGVFRNSTQVGFKHFTNFGFHVKVAILHHKIYSFWIDSGWSSRVLI